MLCRNPLVFSNIAEYLCSVSLVKVCQWVTLTQVQSCREGREESVNWVTWFSHWSPLETEQKAVEHTPGLELQERVNAAYLIVASADFLVVLGGKYISTGLLVKPTVACRVWTRLMLVSLTGTNQRLFSCWTLKLRKRLWHRGSRGGNPQTHRTWSPPKLVSTPDSICTRRRGAYCTYLLPLASVEPEK